MLDFNSAKANLFLYSLFPFITLSPYSIRRIGSMGGVGFANLYINLSDQIYESATAAREAGVAAIYYGSFINTVVTFLIVALVMFWLIRAAARMDKPVEAATPTTKDYPYCMSAIAITATRCPHCTSELGTG